MNDEVKFAADRTYEEQIEGRKKDKEKRKKKKDFNNKADKKKKREFQRRKQKDHEESYETYDDWVLNLYED